MSYPKSTSPPPTKPPEPFVSTDSVHSEPPSITQVPASSNLNLPRAVKWSKDHPQSQIHLNVSTLEQMSTTVYCFVSKIEPKKVTEALEGPFWVEAMQEELLQFERNNVWTLTLLPVGKSAISTKWVLRNKKVENGIVVRNKVRLVAQGYCQEEGIDYEETFSSVARLEAIRIFLAYAAYRDFKVYRMDAKFAILNGKLYEEVYVKQPLRFESEEYPNHVYFIRKALYGLMQAPRAWYEWLSGFLHSHNVHICITDITLFYKKIHDEILLVQIYVDDIIFGSTDVSICKEFECLMQNEFEMSIMGELTFFLALQVKQSSEGIFVNQAKYIQDLLKKYKLTKVYPMRTPMAPNLKLDKDFSGGCVECKLYKGIIGSLLYLTASRPDIIFATCICARYQSDPKESHLSGVKIILRYLKKTPCFGMWYPLCWID
ncbi:hypothetical protein OSB04_024804 [Centaurea solstitialis]|uniref:Reverse transcriptase Ty1/copia-type domain-containing protein n=1 Tax=Centaurea solstitialis TaxID=347529 RepID=A0AA38T5B6_9ASTR|nr:hypothetical protein OSB04_024804 [Centaurea solstitialis]